eukprot:6897432-Pyramimonas_sp.AAC.2
MEGSLRLTEGSLRMGRRHISQHVVVAAWLIQMLCLLTNGSAQTAPLPPLPLLPPSPPFAPPIPPPHPKYPPLFPPSPPSPPPPPTPQSNRYVNNAQAET